MRKQSINEKDIELLRHIYGYGGYVRVGFLESDYFDATYSPIYKRIKKLEKANYLKSKKMYTDSCREPLSFQVTGKTCSMFGNSQSHFRKNHKRRFKKWTPTLYGRWYGWRCEYWCGR